MLQWGRDLLVAESRLTSTIRNADGSLQWGRDLLVAESVNVELHIGLAAGASMGPRLVSRGKTLKTEACSGNCGLQWGRDLLVAERGTRDLPAQALIEASMGPRLVSRGKRGSAGYPEGNYPRFNGAATC